MIANHHSYRKNYNVNPQISNRVTSKQDNIAESFGETVTQSYQTLDIRLGVKPVENITLGIAVLNVFDEAYNSHLNFSFTNQANFSRTPITEPGWNFSAYLQYKF